MRHSIFLLFLAAATLLVGCSSGATQAGKSASSVAKDGATLTGKWKGEIRMAEPAKDDAAAQMGKALAEMMASGIDLEFPDETHFTLTVMTVPIEGDVQRSGNTLTLIRRKILGTTPEEAAKISASVSIEDFDKPINGTISADGTTISLRGTRETEPDMEFVRDHEAESNEPSKIGTPTVSSGESDVVGSYAADVSTIDESKLSSEEKDQLPLIRAMMKSMTIELLADNTFKMKLAYRMEGDWKLVGDKVRLDPKSIDGIEVATDAKSESIVFDYRDGKLWNEPKKAGETTFAFSKLAFR